ncbi:MAG: hypothetical protein AB4290_18475 [Spirulina sp.]
MVKRSPSRRDRIFGLRFVDGEYKTKIMPVIAPKSYIEYRDRGYWVAGTRISLDSVVYAFQNGQSPESIKVSN